MSDADCLEVDTRIREIATDLDTWEGVERYLVEICDLILGVCSITSYNESLQEAGNNTLLLANVPKDAIK